MNQINFKDGLKIYEALSSEVRLTILSYCLESNQLNLDEIAKRLFISNSAVTLHIRKLQEAGLIKISTKSGIRGSKKICSVAVDKLLIDFEQPRVNNVAEFDIDIGHYTNYKIEPTCGIVTTKSVIGEFDDPRYFNYPSRVNAGLLWFSCGYLEYKIPNSLKPHQRLKELQISMELASEAPGYSTYFLSDIHFRLNGVHLGYWTSPGEYNNRKGLFTPPWWYENLGQYGKLKMLTVNGEGTFIDGLLISDVKIEDLAITCDSDIDLTISVPKDAVNVGGLSLFGKGFGDYNQGILVREIIEDTAAK